MIQRVFKSRTQYFLKFDPLFLIHIRKILFFQHSHKILKIGRFVFRTKPLSYSFFEILYLFLVYLCLFTDCFLFDHLKQLIILLLQHSVPDIFKLIVTQCMHFTQYLIQLNLLYKFFLTFLIQFHLSFFRFFLLRCHFFFFLLFDYFWFHRLRLLFCRHLKRTFLKWFLFKSLVWAIFFMKPINLSNWPIILSIFNLIQNCIFRIFNQIASKRKLSHSWWILLL